MHERSLYPPVKSFLEAQGYEVKERSTVATLSRSVAKKRP